MKKSRLSQAVSVRNLAVTGALSAVAAVLMILEFSVPLMPGFIKFDFSELPALIAAFGMGPVYGVAVCLIKNLVHLTVTQTGGVGELCNFILGCVFVLPAGIVYRIKRTRLSALLSALVGTVCMALISIPLNYYVAYPAYEKIIPIETIMQMYQEIFPGANGLLQCLLIFNLPFTFVKGLIDMLLTFLIYLKILPLFQKKK